MAGMYDPFGYTFRDRWQVLEARVEVDGINAGMDIADSLRDPSLDDEWPEWSVY